MELPHPPRKTAAARHTNRPATAISQAGSNSRLVEPSSAAPSWVLVARVVRPHGRHGELITDVLTDFPERFDQRRRLFLISPPRFGTVAREVLVENFWFFRNRLVFKIQGIDSIDDADALRGYDLAIPAAERAPLEGGSVYVSELVGCHIFDLNRDGTDIGEVVDVDRGSSSTDLLVLHPSVRRGTETDLLIPFAQEYVVRIDIAARSIEMRLPAGLLDINAPMTKEERREQANRSSKP